jgi:plasmid stabilization system protein ParE
MIMKRTNLRPVLWSSKAKEDLLSIWRFNTRAASLDLADDLGREIMYAADRLQHNDLLGRRRPELGAGIRSFIVNTHTIFYRIEHRGVSGDGDTGIGIARVLPEQQDLRTLLQS